MWTIGELAARARVTVKTVRFYSDRGLLPEASRSAGGHRRYDADALERLRLIRSLRALDLPVPEVGRALDGDALAEVLAGQLREVSGTLTALRWREAALRLVADCPPGERAERLLLVGSVPAPPDTEALARFWRGWLPPGLPAPLLTAILEQSVPQPPADPTTDQTLAFARLHVLVRDARPGKAASQPLVHRRDGGYDPAVLYGGLVEAYALAAPRLRAGREPFAGEALDCFVSAYATARGVRDTPAFRSGLAGLLVAEPRIDVYWRLTEQLTGSAEPTPGALHDWLLAALRADLAGEGRGLPCTAPIGPDERWAQTTTE
ncbi:MerR family transcriptional regulator [Streptomyces sp. NPDC059740]|uniref:MerR family transcriptional regulator n=1 Tax=Streptomyces sp. NPDC059740 TaxID=3346926 RepID=UPI00365F8977